MFCLSFVFLICSLLSSIHHSPVYFLPVLSLSRLQFFRTVPTARFPGVLAMQAATLRSMAHTHSARAASRTLPQKPPLFREVSARLSSVHGASRVSWVLNDRAACRRRPRLPPGRADLLMPPTRLTSALLRPAHGFAGTRRPAKATAAPRPQRGCERQPAGRGHRARRAWASFEDNSPVPLPHQCATG